MLSRQDCCFTSIFIHLNMSGHFSNFRPTEQASPPDVHVQMSTPVRLPQTLVKAALLDSAAAGSLSVGPAVDCVSPSRATTDTVLPQSSKTLRPRCVNRCVNHSVLLRFLRNQSILTNSRHGFESSTVINVDICY